MWISFLCRCIETILDREEKHPFLMCSDWLLCNQCTMGKCTSGGRPTICTNWPPQFAFTSAFTSALSSKLIGVNVGCPLCIVQGADDQNNFKILTIMVKLQWCKTFHSVQSKLYKERHCFVPKSQFCRRWQVHGWSIINWDNHQRRYINCRSCYDYYWIFTSDFELNIRESFMKYFSI